MSFKLRNISLVYFRDNSSEYYTIGFYATNYPDAIQEIKKLIEEYQTESVFYKNFRTGEMDTIFIPIFKLRVESIKGGDRFLYSAKIGCRKNINLDFEFDGKIKMESGKRYLNFDIKFIEFVD